MRLHRVSLDWFVSVIYETRVLSMSKVHAKEFKNDCLFQFIVRNVS